MERTWNEDDSFMKTGTGCCNIVDYILSWLESDDTEFEVVFGYSICLAAVTYFIARLFVSW
ncbi:hypothetical protein ACOBQJ_00430 [Pelotomaculum propionicicum]|uniref:hypothetical protein n=1 Tax=Pelotomaculum propionicicum TaxID=258475 RepID=UPI003B78A5C5